jgi:hypothetical protein
VESALREGLRGLPPGSTLAHLLAQHRGARNKAQPPPLTEEQILAWADAHKARTGRWPTQTSGPVADAPGEKWHALQAALLNGYRGLPGGDTLSRLFRRRRGAKGNGNNESAGTAPKRR